MSVRAPVKPDPKAKLKDVFERTDRNKDGLISCDELAAVLTALGLSERDVNELFAHIDTNKDGRIQYDEFVDWVVEGGNNSSEKLAPGMSLADVFQGFCGLGHPDMDSAGFHRLCLECGIIDRDFPAPAADLAFSSAVLRGCPRIRFPQFVTLLDLVAKKKGVPSVVVRRRIVETGCRGHVMTNNTTKPKTMNLHSDNRCQAAATPAVRIPRQAPMGTSTSLSAAAAASLSATGAAGRRRGGKGEGGKGAADPRRDQNTSGSLATTFATYCGSDQALTRDAFLRVCKDAGLLPDRFANTEAQLIFTSKAPAPRPPPRGSEENEEAKATGRNAQKLDFSLFEVAIQAMAARRSLDVDRVQRMVAACSGA